MERPALCAVCRLHPVEMRWRPFCSRRCQLEDQARWAEGAYRVPGPPADAHDELTDDDEYDN